MNSVMLPWPDKELSPNARAHWAVKARAAKAYRAACFYFAKAAKVKADWVGMIHLHLEFCPPDARRRDWDNMLASLKSGLDGLSDALDVDDSRFVFHMGRGEKERPGVVRVRIAQ